MSCLSLVRVWYSFVMLVASAADQRTRRGPRRELLFAWQRESLWLHRSRLNRSIRENGPIHLTPVRSATSGLPPTFIDVGTVHLFHDENIAFANRLMQAGVLTKLHINPGSYHALETFTPATHCS